MLVNNTANIKWKHDKVKIDSDQEDKDIGQEQEDEESNTSEILNEWVPQKVAKLMENQDVVKKEGNRGETSDTIIDDDSNNSNAAAAADDDSETIGYLRK